MVYTIVIFANIIILLALGYAMSAKKPEIKQMIRLDDEDFVRTLLPFARSMRVTDYGRGYNLASIYPVIYKAYKLTERKARAKHAMFEYEKWLYQNIYLVKRFIYSQNKISFKRLPHIKNEVRIMELARFVVTKSLCCLNRQRVDLAMQSIKNELSLCFEEICNFNNAIGCAIIEQIYILSQRIIFYNNNKHAAENGYISNKRMSSDIYNYYLLQNPKLREQTLGILEKMGIKPQSVLINYNMSLTESTKMAECLFKALMDHSLFVPKNKILEYHNADNILCKHKSYQNMSLETRLSFYGIIERISDSINVNETLTAARLVELADANKTDIGSILYDHPNALRRAVKSGKLTRILPVKNSVCELWYILCIAVLTLAICFGFYVWTGNLLASILALLPTMLICEQLLNTLVNPYLKKRVLPQMNYQNIPAECNTMVVVSHYICSREQAREAVTHLLQLRAGNLDDNIQLAILADLKRSDSETLDTDKDIIEEFFLLQKYSNCNVFLRKRVKIGKNYGGYERKRGAIMALNDYLLTGKDENFAFILDKNHKKPEFIVTLDADNTVITGTVKDLINIISHPYNSKYDLINAHSRYNLYSVNTLFAKRFLSGAGLSGYPIYSTFYYNLFGKDIFCGKGIYRLKSFQSKLQDILPSKKILSHDILEGAIVQTGCGVTIFEDAPKSFIAERERRKRWQRGDIQLLPFVGKCWKNDEKKPCKSTISPFYRFLIVRNAAAVLKELFLAALALVALIFYPAIWKIFLLLTIMPFVINQFCILQGLRNNIRLRYVAERTVDNAYSYFEDLLMLPYYALSNTIIFIKTLFRMLSHGNLLEWKTYYQTQQQRNFSSYVQEFTPTIVFTALFGGLLFFLGISPLAFLLVMTSAYFFQLSLFISGADINDDELQHAEKQKLMQYAEKTYRFFQLMATPSGIVGDNIQIKPYKGQAKNTSSTNIGFTMLADIAAYYLNLIDKKTAVELVTNRLRSIDIMPKWKGNLYNWYCIDSFQPLNRFISSVDSGNLVAALMITKEFLKEINEKSAAALAEKIIENTNLEALYDHEKGQFFVGYDETQNAYSGHYDILASEARLLSLIFIAKSGKVAHWRNLQRDYTPIMGNTLLSWSGTMFEYLMSDHFIAPPRFSLLYDTAQNAATIQSKSKFKGIWGVSESGYYAFDDELRYQYYAFGLSKLSLRSEFDKGIVSPYSSALALKYLKKPALENLEKIEKAGGFGDYGFYEAIDLSGSPRFISSYMTHHQGMILTALANCLKDNIFCRLMSQNDCINGAVNLLNELKSEYSYTLPYRKENQLSIKDKDEYFENITKVEFSPKAAALTNGTMSVCVDTLGNNFVRWENIYVNAYRRQFGEPNGGYFYVYDTQGNVYSSAYSPLCQNMEDYCISYSAVEITLQNTKKGIKTDICIADGIDAEVRRLSVPEDMKDARVGYYMDICMNTYDGFNAHPIFSNLFVATSFDEENNAIIVHKRSMKKEGDLFAAFIIRGLSDIKVETNRFNLLGRNGSEKSPKFFDKTGKDYPSMGDVLEPAVGFSGVISGNNGECQLITVVAKSQEELYTNIKMLPEDFYRYAKESSRMKIKIAPVANRMLGSLLYTPYPNKTLLRALKSRHINEFREITHHKKAVVYMYDETKNNCFEELLQAARQWKILGVQVRLIIYYSENFKETQKEHIIEQLKTNYIDDFMLAEKSVKDTNVFDYAFAVLDSSLAVVDNRPPENILQNIEIKPDVGIDAFEKDCPESTLKSGNGHFCQNKYVLAQQPALPYSNVICDKFGGMIVTENHGGFFYFENSREFKVTDFAFDPVKDKPYEYILVKYDSGYLRINGGSGPHRKTVYSKGVLEHFCYTQNFDFITQSYIIYEGRAKVTEISVESKTQALTQILYAMYPSLSWKTDRDFVAMETEGSVISIYNLQNGHKLYLKAISAGGEVADCCCDGQMLPYFEFNSVENYPFRAFFVASTDAVLLSSLIPKTILQTKQQSIEKFNSLSNIDIKSPVKSFNYLANNLLYQVYSSRLRGKCGYYQSGGATGFRDQLQDCLAFLHSNPELAREQILYSATKQYEEGDVMHWWHHPSFGLRTRITDDRLYLPYAVSLYVEFTGDSGILDTQLEYLTSPPLAEGQHSRLENPPLTSYKESLEQHCIRAIKSVLRFGEHKLLLLGGGDWNDGLDFAGIEGRGESVALSMLCYEVLQMFKEHCKDENKEYFGRVAIELKKSIETHCFEDGQYKRLFSDEGKWLGAKNVPHYQVDLVAQSFAVLSGIADKDRAQTAMDAAETLVDERLGIIKLLSPPQTKDNYLGYISSYPPGTRENGGQYSHAAIWFIMALIRTGRTEKAYEYFQMINPVEKCRHKDNNKMYMGEPYVLAGDVYLNKDNEGRMGWSWYTGSAAWAYRLIVEEFYGLKRRGDTLVIKPSLPKKLFNSELIYRYKQSEYQFEFVSAHKNRLVVDGIEIEDWEIELHDKKRSRVIVELHV